MTDPVIRSYLAVLPQLATGAETPRGFLDKCLATMASLEPKVGAFVATNLEGARAAADRATERWRAGKPLSKIDGMPVGIKDIIETADMPTEQGSPLFVGYRTGRDAATVAALREAGAVIVGKTVTTEFAATEPRGTRNPWDTDRTPGGSSSGSAAAVGGGMLPAALGTQVIGSILRPASYCGCFGYKPSVGAINRGGSYDTLSQSTTGGLAATLREAWVVARAISARVGGDPGYPGLSGPDDLPPTRLPRTIAVLETAGWGAASAAAKASLHSVIDRLAATGVTIKHRRNDAMVEVVEQSIAEATTLSRKINAWESRWPLNTYSRDRGHDGLSHAMQARLAEAEAMTLDQYQECIAERRHVRDAYARLVGEADCDACISLTAPAAAPLGIESTGDPSFVVPSSLLGVPAVSLPVLREGNLPLGLQVLGFYDGDAALMAVAASIAHPGH
jgi:Asp-tRNA(Asn)/Glu-tRNA(Gln) amidotransferase A subunit family amidase